MAISDEKMWSYYELLTDVLTIQIDALKQGVKTGERHPMEIKKSLARLIVIDFHSREAAEKAADDWAKQFQKREVPEDVEEIAVPLDALSSDSLVPGVLLIKLDKLLSQTGLAESVSDAVRKIKQKAVRVNGELKTDPRLPWNLKDLNEPLTVKVGRKIKKVSFTLSQPTDESFRS
jgi:tyrosyl-tRNA synthetase